MKKSIMTFLQEITIEINGKAFSGYYTEEKGMITVCYDWHTKTTQSSSDNHLFFCNRKSNKESADKFLDFYSLVSKIFRSIKNEIIVVLRFVV